MAIKAPKSSSNGPKQPPLDSGTYPARVVQVLEMGLQPQRPYMGQDKPPAYTIYVTYELVDAFCIDLDPDSDTYEKELEDKPRWISEEFPLHSLRSDKARSTSRYLALDSEMEYDGDWSKLVGTPCMVTITQNKGEGKHEGKIFENISNVSAMRPREAAKCPELVNPPKVLDLDDEASVEVFKSLPEWLQDKVKGGLEFNSTALCGALGGGSEKKEPDNKEEKDSEEEGW